MSLAGISLKSVTTAISQRIVYPLARGSSRRVVGCYVDFDRPGTESGFPVCATLKKPTYDRRNVSSGRFLAALATTVSFGGAVGFCAPLAFLARPEISDPAMLSTPLAVLGAALGFSLFFLPEMVRQKAVYWQFYSDDAQVRRSAWTFVRWLAPSGEKNIENWLERDLRKYPAESWEHEQAWAGLNSKYSSV